MTSATPRPCHRRRRHLGPGRARLLDPWHLGYLAWFAHPVLATALALLLLFLGVLLAARRLPVPAAAVVLMSLGLLLGFVASTLYGLYGRGQGVDRTVSPDGRHELVVELAASERELYRSSFDPGTLRLFAFHCLSPGYC